MSKLIDQVKQEEIQIPKVSLGKFMITFIGQPPNANSDLDGKMVRLAMVKFKDPLKNKDYTELVEINKDNNDNFKVDLPHGVSGVTASVFASQLKYPFKFKDNDNWYSLKPEIFETAYFVKNVLPNIDGADKMTDEEQREQFTEYLSELYDFILMRQLGIDQLPKVGMIIDAYRVLNYSNKTQKWYVNIKKSPPRDSELDPIEDGFEERPEEIGVAIQERIDSEFKSFNYGSNSKNEDEDEDEIPI